MTNAHNRTNAAAQATGRLARLARHGVAMAVLVCTGFGAAQAQYYGRRDDAQLQAPPSSRGERVQLPPQQVDQPREQRGYDQTRDQRSYDDQRRAVPVQQSDSGRRGGRLTPDERRDLRRQINEAGADIYPNAQRR